LAILKLVAVLADVRLDQLVQRDAQRRVRQAIIAGTSVCVGVAAAAVLTLSTISARLAAKQEQARGGTLIEYQLTEMRNRAKAIGRLDLLDAVNRGAVAYYGSQDLTQLPATALEQRAKLLQDIGQDDESRGEFDAARVQFEEARRTTKALLDAAPDDAARMFAHSQSEFWVGENAWRVDRYSFAEERFLAYARLADRLVQIAPGNPDWLMEQGYAQSNLGTFVLHRKMNFVRSEQYYRKALWDFQAAGSYRPRDAVILRETAELYGWLGDVRRLEGDCDGALEYRQQATQLLASLQHDDTQDADLKSAVIANELALARIDICKHLPVEALKKLVKGHDDAAVQFDADPVNVDLRRQTRIFDLFKVQTWLLMPAAARPPAATIANALGDCDAETRIKNNDELATFCIILRDRWSILNGHSDYPGKLSALAKIRTAASAGGLTTRWGLNFQEEARLPSNLNIGKGYVK
jgi:hypothetical protein